MWEGTPVQDVTEWVATTGSKAEAIRASLDMERSVAEAPREAGREISEGLYAIDRGLIRFLYTIDDDQQVVMVVGVRFHTL